MLIKHQVEVARNNGKEIRQPLETDFLGSFHCISRFTSLLLYPPQREIGIK